MNGTQEERKVLIGGLELDREESRKARMLYDYDAINPDEITVNAGEVRLVGRLGVSMKASSLDW